MPSISQATCSASDSVWTVPSQGYTLDAVYASTSGLLTQTYYGFNLTAIPEGSSIDGIIIDTTGYYDLALPANGDILTAGIEITANAGVDWGPGGDGRTNDILYLESGPYTFGGSTDLWGIQIGSGDLRTTDNFRFRMKVIGYSTPAADRRYFHDGVTVYVYYSLSEGRRGVYIT